MREKYGYLIPRPGQEEGKEIVAICPFCHLPNYATVDRGIFKLTTTCSHANMIVGNQIQFMQQN